MRWRFTRVTQLLFIQRLETVFARLELVIGALSNSEATWNVPKWLKSYGLCGVCLGIQLGRF